MAPSEFELIAECRNIGSAAPTPAENTSIQSAVHACTNPGRINNHSTTCMRSCGQGKSTSHAHSQRPLLANQKMALKTSAERVPPQHAPRRHVKPKACKPLG